MGFVRCFDAVNPIIEKTTNQMNGRFVVDEVKENSLKACCETLDYIAGRFNGVSYEVSVKENTDIIISLVCDRLEFDGNSVSIHKLFEQTKMLGFTAVNEDVIQIDFVFSGIWVMAHREGIYEQ